MNITQKKIREAYDIFVEVYKETDDEQTKLAIQVINVLRGKGISEKGAIEILKKSISIIDDLSGTHELL
ncbi:hypothetical protein [Lactiplantibacillus plantarum]|uniref:hypothetical protein n=1 Tax=Lactiplantibacillus plantarum TaxID=1590 RepID=UPI0009330421|nr:hypothetical protein [Lactiplantibacillus plantarum]MCK8474918.1 hypothetical protein [Lactiplantibacillus plantarum]